MRKNIPTHLEQYSAFHCQIKAECFVELKQQAEKNTASTQHLLERVGSLETRLNAVERLQDTLEQRVELLDDRRERHSDRYAGRIEVVENETAKITDTIAQLQQQLNEVQTESTVYSLSRLVRMEASVSQIVLTFLHNNETVCLKVAQLERAVDRCLSTNM